MSNYENAIEICGLSKQFDGFALENISMTLPKGSIMGFVGQNGAGKTTTIKATPHKDRLTALLHIYLQIFRHISQMLLD